MTTAQDMVESLKKTLRTLLAANEALTAARDLWRQEYRDLCPIATAWEERAVKAEAESDLLRKEKTTKTPYANCFSGKPRG